jgi:hypothetical protein
MDDHFVEWATGFAPHASPERTWTAQAVTKRHTTSAVPVPRETGARETAANVRLARPSGGAAGFKLSVGAVWAAAPQAAILLRLSG